MRRLSKPLLNSRHEWLHHTLLCRCNHQSMPYSILVYIVTVHEGEHRLLTIGQSMPLCRQEFYTKAVLEQKRTSQNRFPLAIELPIHFSFIQKLLNVTLLIYADTECFVRGDGGSLPFLVAYIADIDLTYWMTRWMGNVNRYRSWY